MLKNDGVAGVEAGEQLGFGAVRDAGLDADLTATAFLLRVGDFDGGVAVLVVEDGLLGDGEDVLVLLENDLRVGCHVGLELAARVVDRDADLEGGHVVLFDAERSDFGNGAAEDLVAEALASVKAECGLNETERKN